MSDHRVRYIGLSIVLLSTFLVYLPTLNHQFVWDDERFVLDWQTPKLGFRGLIPLMLGDVPIGHEGIYRPLRGLYYFLSYSLLGENPILYHLSGVFIYLLGVYIVYRLTRLLLNAEIPAQISALIFGLHPVHVESVTWITSSFDTLGQILGLTAVYRFILWLRRKTRLNYYSALGFTFLAVFSHETASVLPLLFLLADYLFHQLTLKQLLKRRYIYLPFLFVVLLYWFIRSPLLHITARQPYPFGNFAPIAWYMGKIYVTKYAANLFLPLQLTVNHPLGPGIQSLFWADLNHQNPPVFPGYSSPDLFLSWILIILVVFLIIQNHKRLPLFSYSLGYILINLIPFIQIFPISALYQERYLFPASVGFCLLVGWFYQLILKKIYPLQVNYSTIIVLCLMLSYPLFLGYQTFRRNSDWKNNFTLWKQAIEANPESNSNHTNLGNAYYSIGDLDEAINQYSLAQSLNPSQAINYTNLGIIQYQSGDRAGAKSSFEKAINLTPISPLAYLYLGILAHQNRDLKTAENYYQKFQSIYPRYPDSYLYLGMLRHEAKLFDVAQSYYLKALSLKPDYADAYNNLGNLYRDLGQQAEAVKAYDAALKINPNHQYAGKNLTEMLKLTPKPN